MCLGLVIYPWNWSIKYHKIMISWFDLGHFSKHFSMFYLSLNMPWRCWDVQILLFVWHLDMGYLIWMYKRQKGCKMSFAFAWGRSSLDGRAHCFLSGGRGFDPCSGCLIPSLAGSVSDQSDLLRVRQKSWSPHPGSLWQHVKNCQMSVIWPLCQKVQLLAMNAGPTIHSFIPFFE